MALNTWAAKNLGPDADISRNPAEGGGGSEITVEALTVTENDTYTAPEGKAYSPVTVNVEASLAPFTVDNQSGQQIIVSGYTVSAGKVVTGTETIQTGRQKELKMPFDNTDSVAHGIITISFSTVAAFNNKTVSVTNGTLLNTLTMSNNKGWIIEVQQAWTPSEPPVITVSST